MPKENFTRYSMRENMLKKILIRVDYDGVTDINKWIDIFKATPDLNSHFNDYGQSYLNKASFDLSKMEEVARQRSLPISAFDSVPIHHFRESHFDGHQDRVNMEIAGLFMTFQVDCVHYTNIDDYFDYLNRYLASFMESDRYIKIKRIGIRKIGGDSFASTEDMNNTFEAGFFEGHTIDNADTTIIEREYHDRFMKTMTEGDNANRSVKVNYSTHCRRIESERPFQAVLDIDTYIDEYIIRKDNLAFPAALSSSLTLINDYMFELYKMSVTLSYLNEHGEPQQ